MMSGPGGGSARGGRSTENQAVKEGGMTMQDAPRDNDGRTDERRGSLSKDSLRLRKRTSPAWFAAVPPGIRKAMKSRQQKSLPRGYEERLKRYFESLD